MVGAYEAEQDEIRVHAVQTMPRVGVIPRRLSCAPDVLHDFVFAFARDGGVGEHGGEAAPVLGDARRALRARLMALLRWVEDAAGARLSRRSSSSSRSSRSSSSSSRSSISSRGSEVSSRNRT